MNTSDSLDKFAKPKKVGPQTPIQSEDTGGASFNTQEPSASFAQDLSDSYTEIRADLDKQTEKLTKHTADLEFHNHRIDKQDQIVLYGFIVLLVMVATLLGSIMFMVFDHSRWKVETYRHLADVFRDEKESLYDLYERNSR